MWTIDYRFVAIVLYGFLPLAILSSPLAESKVNLPLGIPRIVDTNGSILSIDYRFTTPEYQKAALNAVINEANHVALELNLHEQLPITQSNIVSNFISPFGYAYMKNRIGNVTTSNYTYYVSEGNKFSFLESTHIEEKCLAYQSQYTWPLSELDTNLAYELAAQSLMAVSMDINGLNRDFDLAVVPDNTYVHSPKDKFVPIYHVLWKPKDFQQMGGAEVTVFTPTRTLLEMRVEEPQYIKREPLVISNLSELFPGTAQITTNLPGVIHLSAPGSY